MSDTTLQTTLAATYLYLFATLVTLFYVHKLGQNLKPPVIGLFFVLSIYVVSVLSQYIWFLGSI